MGGWIFGICENYLMDWWIFVYFRDNYGFVTFAYTCDAYAAIESKSPILDLKAPITNCQPRSDCFFRSNLIWVHTVCSYA